MKTSIFFEKFFDTLPTIKSQHAPGTKLYSFLKSVVRLEVERLFSEVEVSTVEIKPFGNLIFPYHSMGAIDSLNLFDLDELIIFSFYWTNRNKYKKILDLGANLGLHSIMMHRCGYAVICYEPDPIHFKLLQRNLDLNNVHGVKANNKAISYQNGEMEFIRVLGNTTGSHLSGAKANPYGDLERFPVKLAEFRPLLKNADLIKMDIEGHEKKVVLSTMPEDWLHTDAFVEIENKDNGTAIFDFFSESSITLFSQKKNWEPVKSLEAMPTSYREGSLFISSKREMPWE